MGIQKNINCKEILNEYMDPQNIVIINTNLSKNLNTISTITLDNINYYVSRIKN